MLTIEGLSVAYGDFQILWNVSLRVGEGEIVALLGPNGAGKSTLLASVSGLVRPKAGRIEFRGRRLDELAAHRRVGLGLAHVLERRRLFPYLTVRQNLLLGAYHPEARRGRAQTLAWVESLFPSLRGRAAQPSHTLSGGEQQMVAIGRGLMSRPHLLMVDEPTLGLAPRVAAEILDVLRELNRAQGLALLFIEQNVELALSLAQRGYILESGRLLLAGSSTHLLGSDEVRRVFLGL
ncbi:MAG: branched-chain amino acid ABC transporter ATP-binding protein [Candidatus Rokuibacteriota bacterium]|nr:MAG: branched-chain amino acid ABC transporter ATP-binding protein [Candidatus Rokubacteria bacterium]